MANAQVRQPAVAGMFYPGEEAALRQMVRGFLDEAPSGAPEPRGMVAPHAGYVYSGYTAACAYNTLKEAPADQPRRIFLLGPSHRVPLKGMSVGNYSAYRTPLGDVPIDRAMTMELAGEKDITLDPVSHTQEHSLEVHLPFLQEVVKHFTLVPLVFGKVKGSRLADLLDLYRRPDDLIIISSDLSHFYAYEEAKALDEQCHKAVLGQDPGAMKNCKACGDIGMQALIELSRRWAWRPTLADYRNSGDTAGEKDRVVGYASYLFYGKELSGKSRNDLTRSSQTTDLNSSVTFGSQLPAIARAHLKSVLANGKGLDPAKLASEHERLAEEGACFVTLTKNGQLRGCIGTLEAHRSLSNDLLGNAVSAATRDPRFPPVTSEELSELSVEVSILTPAKPLNYRDSDDLLAKLQPGVHGVILEMSGHRSTFLPQVWEQMASKEQFLNHLCQKAGLGSDCWQMKPNISLYTVDKFIEGQSQESEPQKEKESLLMNLLTATWWK
ncbi:MAG: AmmeMemoRadiSam system protein B [Magnetococcales bacterium]|nr:AmmeMemoRadiSam system protein B [Magnetococcales bacterium]